MKKTFFIAVIIIAIGGFSIYIFKNRLNQDLAQPVALPTTVPSTVPTIVKNNQQATTSLFVPYWTTAEQPIDTTAYNNIIYFGISPTADGIPDSDAGLTHLQEFSHAIPDGEPKLLTLSMTNSQLNLKILKNKANQGKIISQAIEIAKQNTFKGIVLDLEVSAIPFDNLVQQIDDFTKQFSEQTKTSGLSFALTIYGDTFYRLRPFNLKDLSQYADSIMIMAYDFHKAGGGMPGPNFPLSGQDTYGYDLQKMADDFLQAAPAQKLTVVFGLFGYDWTLNEKGASAGTATPLTDTQIQQKFLNSCAYSQCKIQRDPQSDETTITYTDNQQKKHVIWFEDMQSIKQKEAILRQKGINSFSLWAYSYF